MERAVTSGNIYGMLGLARPAPLCAERTWISKCERAHALLLKDALHAIDRPIAWRAAIVCTRAVCCRYG